MTTVGDHVGPYELRGPLGAGGMGEVWRARDPRLGRDVALKLLPAALNSDPDRLRRFEQEARATGALSHPNILAVHDFAVQDGTAYLVSELLEGETLRARLRRGPVPARKAIEIASQIAQGLSAAHAKGVVHRDLKPDNLFLTADGRTKILDFGLAKIEPVPGEGDGNGGTLSEGTKSGAILGSVGYMAPEQVRGQPADARSDLFALGAVLYEMIAGTRAFAADTPVEVGYATLNRDPPDLPGASPGLARVLRRCLEKAPAERFQSAHDLAFALEALVSDSEPKANGLPAASAPRRSPWLLALVVVGAIAAAVALASRFTSRPAARAATPRTVPSFTRVTYRTGFIHHARFAEGGRTVVFAASIEGSPFQVYRATPGRPEARPVSDPWVGLFAISDDDEVALALAPSRESTKAEWSLARAPLAGGEPRPIATGVSAADFAPDASLVLVRSERGRQRLEHRGKVLFQTDGQITCPRISPRGDAVAFLHWPVVGDDRGTVDLVTLAGEHRTLAGPWFTENGLAWAPSGQEVWYTASQIGGVVGLRAVGRDGRDRLVFEGPGRMELQDIAQDGRVLLTRVDSRFRVYGVVPGDTREVPLSWLDGSLPIDLSSDGRRLLFIEGLAGSMTELQTYLRPTDGSPAVRLASGLARALSPDGQWAVVSPDAPFTSLLLVPTGAGESRRLPAGPFASISSVSYFADGRRILIGGRESGRAPRLWVQDLQSGAPRPIGDEGLERPTPPSPDGSTVAAVRADRQAVTVAVETGTVRVIEGLVPGDTPLQWSADGRSLFVRPRSGNRPNWPVEVFLFDIATKVRTPWRALEPGDRAGVAPGEIAALLITPDARHHVWSYPRYIGDLYVVEGLR